MAEQFANHPGTTLAVAITTATRPVTVTLSSSTGLPTSPSFRLLIEDEILLVSAVLGSNSYTASNVEGTAAATHAMGVLVTHILTAGALVQLEADVTAGAGSTAFQVANNLSECTPSVARTNLGLGSAAVANASALTEATSSVLTITGGSTAVLNATSIQVKQASGSQAGYLSSADWTTFNSKQSALGFVPLNPANNLSEVTASTARTNLGLTAAAIATPSALTETTSAVLTITGGSAALLAATTIQVKQASGSQAGYLASADWTTFNAKQATVSITNDTNVTGSISAGVITLGWAGTLAIARGGIGASSFLSAGLPTLSANNNFAGSQTISNGGTGVLMFNYAAVSTSWARITSVSGTSANYNGLWLATNDTIAGAQGNTALPSWAVDIGGFDATLNDSFNVRRKAAGGSVWTTILFSLSNAGVPTFASPVPISSGGTGATSFSAAGLPTLAGANTFTAANTFSVGGVAVNIKGAAALAFNSANTSRTDEFAMYASTGGTLAADTLSFQSSNGAGGGYVTSYITTAGNWVFAAGVTVSGALSCSTTLGVTGLTTVNALSVNGTATINAGLAINTTGSPISFNITSQSNFSTGLSINKRGDATLSSNPIASGSEIGYHSFYGWDGSGYGRAAFVYVQSAELFASGHHGANYSIYTTAVGATDASYRMMVANNGNVLIGTLTDTGQLLQVAGTIKCTSIDITAGTNTKTGSGTLVAGTVTISNTSVTANSKIFVTPTSNSANSGALAVITKTAGTSFVVKSSNSADTATFDYFIVETA